MAYWSGWVAVALILAAGVVPLLQRLREGRRAAPTSPSTRFHVVVGLTVAFVTFLHTLVAVLALGSPSAVAVGDLALAAGGLGFLVLTAHTGLGLQLRQPKLKQRGDKRRSHVLTAITITLAVAAHAVLLLNAGP
jgi:hypothetical protein